MNTCLYFAFGSNMLRQRLTVPDRCASAVPLGPAVAAGFRVTMWKRSSRDGSGKATLVKAEGHAAHGVLYKIGLDELALLDKSEGVGFGYEREPALAVRRGAEAVTAHAYIAPPDYVDAALVPFDWYAAMCIAGADQHALPDHHVEALAAIPMQPDPEPERETRQRALRMLRAAGYAQLAEQCEAGIGTPRLSTQRLSTPPR